MTNFGTSATHFPSARLWEGCFPATAGNRSSVAGPPTSARGRGLSVGSHSPTRLVTCEWVGLWKRIGLQNWSNQKKMSLSVTICHRQSRIRGARVMFFLVEGRVYFLHALHACSFVETDRRERRSMTLIFLTPVSTVLILLPDE